MKKRYWLRGALVFTILLLPLFLMTGDDGGVGFGLSPIGEIWLPLLFVIGFSAVNNFFFFLIGGTIPPNESVTRYTEPPQAVAERLAAWAQYVHDSKVAFTLTVITYILIGAFLGWLFGKYRERFPGGYGAKPLR